MLSAIGCTTTSSNMTPQIKPGDLFTYKPAEQYKNTVRFLLFTTPDRSMYAFFDPIDNTVHLIDYIKVDTSDVELL